MPYTHRAYLRQKESDFTPCVILTTVAWINLVKLLHQPKIFVVRKFPGQDRSEIVNHFYSTCELKQFLKEISFLFFQMFFLCLYRGVANIRDVHKQRSEPVDDVPFLFFQEQDRKSVV